MIAAVTITVTVIGPAQWYPQASHLKFHRVTVRGRTQQYRDPGRAAGLRRVFRPVAAAATVAVVRGASHESRVTSRPGPCPSKAPQPKLQAWSNLKFPNSGQRRPQ